MIDVSRSARTRATVRPPPLTVAPFAVATRFIASNLSPVHPLIINHPKGYGPLQGKGKVPVAAAGQPRAPSDEGHRWWGTGQPRGIAPTHPSIVVSTHVNPEPVRATLDRIGRDKGMGGNGVGASRLSWPSPPLLHKRSSSRPTKSPITANTTINRPYNVMVTSEEGILSNCGTELLSDE